MANASKHSSSLSQEFETAQDLSLKKAEALSQELETAQELESALNKLQLFCCISSSILFLVHFTTDEPFSINIILGAFVERG